MLRIAVLAIGLPLIATGALAQVKSPESDEFRTSDKKISDYVKDGYEVKGGNGQQIMLQKGKSLALCYFNQNLRRPGTELCLETK